jgi:hypothetical protein
MQQRHRELAEPFGNQPSRSLKPSNTNARITCITNVSGADVARRAVTFARDRNLEREAVVEERAILRDALQRSFGEGRVDDIKAEVNRRIERGEFLDVPHESGAPGRSFTTPPMMQLEQDTIDSMRAGQGQHPELVPEADTRSHRPRLRAPQSKPAHRGR